MTYKDQPRAPKGKADGGQWTDAKAGSSSKTGVVSKGDYQEKPKETGPSKEDKAVFQKFVEWDEADTGQYDRMRDPKTPEGKEFHEALSRLPDYEGTVYRGALLSDDQLAKVLRGDTLDTDLVLSGSTDRYVAQEAAEGQFWMVPEEQRTGNMVMLKLEMKTSKYIATRLR